MLPKQFDLDYYREAVLRRKWYIVGPFFLIIIAAMVYIVTAPRMYKATTLILLQQQRVPEAYIRSTVTASLVDRISTIKQQITNRTNLESLITKFDLYGDRRVKIEQGPTEEKVEFMQKAIEIQVTRGTAFSISFTYHDRRTAMAVTNELASNFITENLRLREDQSIGTTQFLENELRVIEANLGEKEAALTAYKQKHMGALPDQQQTNLTLLGQLRQKIENIERSLAAVWARRSMIQEQASLMRDMMSLTPAGDPSALVSRGGGPSAAELPALRERIKSLTLRYTEKHPDVLKLKRMIAKIEAEEEQKASSTEGSPLSQQVQGEPRPGSQAQDGGLQMELAVIDREIKELQNEKARLERESARLTQVVGDVPQRQMELTALQRDYDTIKGQYDSLLAKKLESQLAANMERRQQGEQFNVLDFAKLPEKPVTPNVRKILLGALFVGLATGCGLALGLEYFDESFRAYSDLRDFLQMPVLAVIPHVSTKAEAIKKRRYRLISYYLGGCLLLVMGVCVWLYLNFSLHELLEKIRAS